MEEWKDVIEYEGLYKVSNTGKIMSCERIVNSPKGKRIVKSKILKSIITSTGYPRVHLSKEGAKNKVSVHRIVAIAFIDNPDNKPQVNHINGIKTDNTVGNLEWVTSLENISHSWNTGLSKAKKSEDSSNCKLNTSTVLEIKKLLKESNGKNQLLLAKQFGISQATISMINNGKIWANT
ncbi:endodeoxyribonuclease [Elizabethkingia anophelis]|nr:endodeoxyribonuclease [Elizabethkingia anophelis]